MGNRSVLQHLRHVPPVSVKPRFSHKQITGWESCALHLAFVGTPLLPHLGFPRSRNSLRKVGKGACTEGFASCLEVSRMQLLGNESSGRSPVRKQSSPLLRNPAARCIFRQQLQSARLDKPEAAEVTNSVSRKSSRHTGRVGTATAHSGLEMFYWKAEIFPRWGIPERPALSPARGFGEVYEARAHLGSASHTQAGFQATNPLRSREGRAKAVSPGSARSPFSAAWLLPSAPRLHRTKTLPKADTGVHGQGKEPGRGPQ